MDSLLGGGSVLTEEKRSLSQENKIQRVLMDAMTTIHNAGADNLTRDRKFYIGVAQEASRQIKALLEKEAVAGD